MKKPWLKVEPETAVIWISILVVLAAVIAAVTYVYWNGWWTP